MKDFTDYINEVNQLYQTGNATEHSYRSALKKLIENILSDEILHSVQNDRIQVINEPRRIDCGAPDYIITRANIPVCYIEAKDIGIDLNSKQNKAQFDRYINSLDNLIITDYLTFIFYQKQQRVDTIQIAKCNSNFLVRDNSSTGKLTLLEENLTKFENFINAFAHAEPQSITKSQKLAKIMANKAKLMAEVIEMILNEDDRSSDFQSPRSSDFHSPRRGVLHTPKSSLYQEKIDFQEILIKNISNHDFADIYAQTITYGMFAARLQNTSHIYGGGRGGNLFDRKIAAELIPKTNPFLRKFFQNIAVFDLDTRFSWIVDDLAESFRVTDMNAVMGELGDKDPIIHFYEYFLSEYNPTLRKNRGVYYTPNEVVNFIVRAVDDILINDFELPMGLADTSQIPSPTPPPKMGGVFPPTFMGGVGGGHKVQILDPATGTGTFLVETIKQIHHKFSSQQGLWQSYVSDHLLPRLNGFEILMAPYTMAHLNLNWTLEKTGFTNENEKRLRVFLTNSLDEFSEGHRGQDRLFSQEADEAGTVKLDTPVMVVLGNPPYSGVSLNKDEWILKKINDYKYTEGVYFNERKHWLNDDYVKFIRLGQDFVDKNKSGVLAYITNHSFLDNPTFRAMRWNLLKSFDKIYIIDLHGSSLKKEITLDGAKDENVFDIMQGVSINIFVKSKPNFSCHCDEHSNQEDSSTRKLTPLAEIFHHDLYGKRKDKFTFLLNNNLYTVPFKKVEPQAPFYFFTPKIFDNKSEYEKGFKINELMEKNVSGIVTMGDGFIINNDKKELFKRINKLVRNEYNKHDLDTKFSLGRNYSKWVLNNISKIIPDENKLIQINYRPFDTRWVYFETNTIWRMRDNIMRHFMNGPNVGLMLCRQQKAGEFHHCFVHRNIVESSYVSNNTSEIGYSFPLYFKPEKENKFAQPNMNMAIVQKIANHIGKQSVTTKQFFSYAISDENNELTPINIFDYIYARLHSPSYREKYKEFLKIDFPRVPYPVNADEFWHYVKVGRRLRKLHLMDGVQSDYQIANFNIAGDNSIDKPKYINIDDEIGKVYINETQYFDNVPLVAWEFYIGGYQPAQKWLKDRKGKALSYDDVIHYQKIIQVLQKTETIMKDIDDIEGKKV